MLSFPKNIRDNPRLLRMHQDCYEATMRYVRNRVNEKQVTEKENLLAKDIGKRNAK